eukprot:3882672-Alexandrium_andersonii.AAC.1
MRVGLWQRKAVPSDVQIQRGSKLRCRWAATLFSFSRFQAGPARLLQGPVGRSCAATSRTWTS